MKHIKTMVILIAAMLCLLACSAYADMNVGETYKGSPNATTIDQYFTPSETGDYILTMYITGFSGSCYVYDAKGNALVNRVEFSDGQKKAIEIRMEAGINYHLKFTSNWGRFQSYQLTLCTNDIHANKSEWELVKAPTCTENGREEKNCTVCGRVSDSRIVPALGHDATGIMGIEREASCAEEGVKRLRCRTCKQILQEQDIPKLDHVLTGEWTPVTAATCTVDGQEAQICTGCGQVIYTRTVLAHGHTPGMFEVDPYSGTQQQTCTVCGEVLEHKALPVTPVGSVWTCEKCGNRQAFGNFCFECGSGKPGIVICPSCGKLMPDDYSGAFCMYCGTKLDK